MDGPHAGRRRAAGSGAGGDVRPRGRRRYQPRVVGGLDGHADNIRATWALGEEIGAEVVRVYRTLQPQPLEARIEIATRQIELPCTYRELFADFRRTAIPVPTTLLRIGPLARVTFPGELFSGIGKRVKAACPAPHAHLMGYTNGKRGLPARATRIRRRGLRASGKPFRSHGRAGVSPSTGRDAEGFPLSDRVERSLLPRGRGARDEGNRSQLLSKLGKQSRVGSHA